ncbi:MAG TPA: DNA polymerase/3'-5' exonuclease PolX [Planctomycetaceae bacterium]|nr:DNA polymerase/3'-5' exonuclease PolX [Planctomycetaceae bacterium]
MQNGELVRIFEELADLLEIQNANPFRVRAYCNAARMLGDLPESIAQIVADSQRNLEDLPGIGRDLADKIKIIIASGTLPQLEELRVQVPRGVVEMLRLPGMGPKKAATLFKELSVTSLEALKAAVESGAVAKLRGFGEKTAAGILAGLANLEATPSRVYFATAQPLAEVILADLRKVPSVRQAEIAGSFRRRLETIGDLDLLVTAADSAATMDSVDGHPLVETVLSRGDTKLRVRLNSGIEMDVRVVPEESYGAALQYFTGSKAHNIVVRKRGQERGLKINEYGVFRGEQSAAGRTEEEVYAAVDLPWIPPELREDRGEIELAEQGKLPALVELDDIRGDLHMHTTATDGTATIAEMIEGAKARGLKYIAITDHSKRVSMARGLDADRLRAHWNEIEKVRRQTTGIEVLCGVECDILEDATLDLPDDVLAEADWVIAVLHYGLKQPREQIMKRLMAAIRNPHVAALGHLTGRMLGKRPGAEMDRDQVLKAAADHGVMIEINAHPSRLDIDDVGAAAARALGIPIVIDTDAHSVKGLDVMQYGILQARRAGLEAKDVANTKTWPQFKKLLRNKKSRA